MNLTINADVDGRTMEQFQELIQKRRQMLNETTERSCIAALIETLKSVKAATKIANPNKPDDIKLSEQGGVHQGYRMVGRRKVPCLRFDGSEKQFPLQKGMRFVVADKRSQAKNNLIYTWRRRTGTLYIIAAPSEKSAYAWAKDAEKKRIAARKGLARLALGLLTVALAKTTLTESAKDDVRNIALKAIGVESSSTGGFDTGLYRVTAADDLRYAKDALKGGPAVLTTCMQKAMNKITANVNRKCSGMLGFDRLETPFPELRKRK